MTLDNRPAHTGGCQCGAVRFRIEGALGRASICHCRMCQKAFGAFYAPLVSVGDAKLAFTRGEMRHFQSSNLVRRGFCADCGTPMSYEAPDGIALSIGIFDDPSPVAPVVQFGTEAKLAYTDRLATLPMRETMEDLADASFLTELVSFQHPDHDTGDDDFAKGFAP